MSYTELNLLTKMELDSVTHCTNTTMAQLLLRKWVWFTERKMGVHDRMLTHTRPTAKLFDLCLKLLQMTDLVRSTVYISNHIHRFKCNGTMVNYSLFNKKKF